MLKWQLDENQEKLKNDLLADQYVGELIESDSLDSLYDILSRFESEIRQDQKQKDARRVRFSSNRFYPKDAKRKIGEKESVIHILDAVKNILEWE